MKIDIKQCKCKRKMFFLNYKWKTFIISKGLIRNIENLQITVPCNTESSEDEIKRYKLSVSKPIIRERIVPKCFRHKCRKDCYKNKNFREQQIKIKTKINKTKNYHSMKFRNENLYPEIKYDDISSGSLSSYEDMETLMSSTRTRMKELNDRWELFPASTHLNTKIKGSVNSLDTIFFGNEFHEDTMKYKTNTRSFYSPMNEDMNIETKNVMSKSDNSRRYKRNIMSKQKYFSSYKSPNICIVPNSSICYPPSPKRPKIEMPVRDNSPQNIDVSFLDDFDIDEIVKCLNDCDENAQNTARQRNIENNNDILEKGCPKSSYKIENNERNELKYSNIEKDLLTETIDNEQIEMVIENTHKCTEKEVKESSANYNKNRHEDVYIDKDNLEIIVSSPITEQPNNETCNIINDSSPNKVTSSENITHQPKNNNNQELIKEKRIKNCLIKTEQDLASTNTAPKLFDGDGNKDIVSNDITKNFDNIKKEDTYLQYNDSEVNKHNTTILEVEGTINTNEAKNKQFHDTQEVSNYFESENLENKDSLQIINNSLSVKEQNNTNKKQVVFLENVDKPKPDLIFNNLEKVMFQCLHKKYSMFSLIHTGKFSKIFKCKDLGGKEYAVKMLIKKGNGYRKEGMWNGIQSDIPKENLLCVYLIAGFSLNNNWCYLTDFYPKNLKEVLKESKKNLHIDTIQALAGQLVGAVTTLRNKNIVHSDINPSHILLDCTNSKLRLCGFDVAYYIQSATLFPYKGTKCYRAPEVTLGYSAGFSLDVWSTALVLHEMATGIQLFGGCIGEQLLYKQMCILGDVPPQMLLRSRFRNKYIIGYCVQRDQCLRHKHNSMVKGRNKIACTVQGAYFSHWTAGKNQKQISRDMQKIRQFTRLLEQMLVIYPERRLPIEFAYSNPFIYQVFNN